MNAVRNRAVCIAIGARAIMLGTVPTASPITNPLPILDCSILLVNDKRDALDVQWAVLADQGYRLKRADGAEEAMQAMSRSDDIAVAIIDLPEPDGASLLNDLRARNGETVEYILVSDGADAGESLDGSDILPRPLDGARLIAAVSDAYNVARMQRFRLAERRSLEHSLAEFQAQTQAAMSRLIARASGGPDARPAAAPVAPGPDAGLSAFAAGELLHARLREKLFGAVALRHSGWMLLLVLAEAWSNGGELTIKSAAYAAGLPLSSALRTINTLCDAGLIVRRDDTLDARRSFVALTPQGQSQFTHYAAAVARAQKK